MKRLVAIFIATLVVAAGCGGNYSNEDIDFQLALPEKEDLAAKLPAQSLEITDSSEYYRTTRNVVRLFNGLGGAFLTIIDAVRAFPPTERNGARRIWGPFPNERFREWVLRLVIDRVGDPLAPTRFEYEVQFRRAQEATAAWTPLIKGSFAPGGGVRRGEGSLQFITGAARAATYPLEGLTETDELRVDYQTRSFPVTVKITLVGFPTRQQLVYEYAEAADGSGSMRFESPFPEGGVIASALLARSRWNGAGAGRADVTVTKGFVAGQRAVDCWGIDTRATHVFRQWAPAETKGAETSCVFGPPEP
jgi:hypothetical protein